MPEKQFVESLDRVNRAMQSSDDLNQMMIAVLDVVLSIFDCDRTFLLYPCDPNTPTWTVPMERNKTEYPGVFELNLEIPIDPDVAKTFQILLDSTNPIKFGLDTSHPLPPEVSKRFGMKSILSMAVYPKIGKPWQFGMHQCSYKREWTDQEEKLLEEIGRRLEDILSSFLIHRNLQKSEEIYRTLLEKIQAAVVVHSTDTSILMSNSMAQDILGLTSKELEGKESSDPIWHFSNEDGKYVPFDQFPVNQVLNTRKKVRNYVLKVQRHKIKNDIWVLVNADPVFDKDGKIIEVIVTFIDITERKKAETDLEEERKLFIGGKNVAFRWKATEGWPIEYVSPNIAKEFGYSPKYLIDSQTKYSTIIHPEDLKNIRNAIENYNRKGIPYFELE